MAVCNETHDLHILTGVDLEIIKRSCNREAVEDGKCCCHWDDPTKPLNPILDEIKNISIQPDKLQDLSYFVFPDEPFSFPTNIVARIFFEHCKFYGEVDFRARDFPTYASFHSARFYRKVDFGHGPDPYRNRTRFQEPVNFSSAIFYEDVVFRSCLFSKLPEFNGTIFKKVANFALAMNSQAAEGGSLEFRQVEFHGNANLDIRGAERLDSIAFRYCDLRGLLIGSLPREQCKIEFEGIKRWDVNERKLFPRRKRIRDERNLNIDAVNLINLYKYLEAYYYDHADYGLASHFYRGMMLAQRRDKNYRWPSRVLNFLYQKTSDYGESLLRPAFGLALVWLIFPLILLLTGMPVYRNNPTDRVIIETVEYDVTDLADDSTRSQFLNDYRSVLGSNLSLSTIDRKHELSPPSDSLQKAMLILETGIIVILGSLLVVAARRKFTPKKPTGT